MSKISASVTSEEERDEQSQGSGTESDEQVDQIVSESDNELPEAL